MNKLLERITIKKRENGWYVNFNNYYWRFQREDYAHLFASKVARDEDFMLEVIQHDHAHNWDECKERPCQGLIWQLVQGLN
jgi:hypothetical protein